MVYITHQLCSADNRTLAAKKDKKKDKKSDFAARLPAPCWCHTCKLCTSEES